MLTFYKNIIYKLNKRCNLYNNYHHCNGFIFTRDIIFYFAYFLSLKSINEDLQGKVNNEKNGAKLISRARIKQYNDILF